jgi:hypothetical protein
MLCIIEVDLSRAPMLTKSKATGNGRFHSLGVDVILLFGMTEFTAQVAWIENVSSLHMLFKTINTWLILRVVFRGKRNGKFLKKRVFLS